MASYGIMDIGKGPKDGQSYDEWLAQRIAKQKAEAAARVAEQAEIDAKTPATLADIKRLEKRLGSLNDDNTAAAITRSLEQRSRV